MKNYLLFVLISFLYAPYSYAQVLGKVNLDSGEPLPFANVLIKSVRDSSLIKGELTETDGSFYIESVPDGTYFLNINLIGYESWISSPFEISPSQPSYQFNSISIAEEPMVMSGIEVTAQKMQIEQTMEGTTFNVQSSMMSKGSTALQILERSPGVYIDQRNNSLSLNGQSGTLIMINGRPVRIPPNEIITLLNGMSADNLEKVELLTNPSAKYDADGTAGIINLVMKKNDDQGTNGSVSGSLGYGWGPKEALSMNINHRKRGTNYYSTYSFNHDVSYSDFHGAGHQNVALLGGKVINKFANHTNLNTISHNITAGVEKELDKGFLIGTNLFYTHTNQKSDILNLGDYWYQDDSYLHANINVNGNNRVNNFNMTLLTEKKFTDNKKLNVDLDYIYFDSSSPTFITSDYTDETETSTNPDNELFANANRGESNTAIHIGVAKADYQTIINPKLTLESGVKATFSETNNAAKIERYSEGEWIIDDRNESSLEVLESIGAAYSSLNYAIDSVTTIQAGLRYEYWDQQFSEGVDDRSFGKLFPSFFIRRDLTQNASIQFAYTKRITRPDYNDLINYLRYNGPISVFTGTPTLNPSIIDNIKLGFQIKDKNISLVYTYENNPIARYQLTKNESSDLILVAPQNVDYQQSIGIQTNLPFQLTNWWMFTLWASFEHREFHITHTPKEVYKDYLYLNLNANQTISLPKNFSVEISGWYLSDHYNGSIKNYGFGQLNLGIKKELNNNGGSFQFTVTDVLQSVNVRPIYGELTREVYDNYAQVKFQPESTNAPIFRLSYVRTFGNNQLSGRKNRRSGSQEEKSRIGQ